MGFKSLVFLFVALLAMRANAQSVPKEFFGLWEISKVYEDSVLAFDRSDSTVAEIQAYKSRSVEGTPFSAEDSARIKAEIESVKMMADMFTFQIFQDSTCHMHVPTDEEPAAESMDTVVSYKYYQEKLAISFVAFDGPRVYFELRNGLLYCDTNDGLVMWFSKRE